MVMDGVRNDWKLEVASASSNQLDECARIEGSQFVSWALSENQVAE